MLLVRCLIESSDKVGRGGAWHRHFCGAALEPSIDTLLAYFQGLLVRYDRQESFHHLAINPLLLFAGASGLIRDFWYISLDGCGNLLWLI